MMYVQTGRHKEPSVVYAVCKRSSRADDLELKNQYQPTLRMVALGPSGPVLILRPKSLLHYEQTNTHRRKCNCIPRYPGTAGFGILSLICSITTDEKRNTMRILGPQAHLSVEKERTE